MNLTKNTASRVAAAFLGVFALMCGLASAATDLTGVETAITGEVTNVVGIALGLVLAAAVLTIGVRGAMALWAFGNRIVGRAK